MNSPGNLAPFTVSWQFRRRWTWSSTITLIFQIAPKITSAVYACIHKLLISFIVNIPRDQIIKNNKWDVHTIVYRKRSNNILEIRYLIYVHHKKSSWINTMTYVRKSLYGETCKYSQFIVKSFKPVEFILIEISWLQTE